MNYVLREPQYDNKSALIQVLLNRGIAEKDISHYLNTTDDDLIDPATLEHIDEGALLLLHRITLDDDIYIQVDADVDGYTSAAILINYMYRIWPDFVLNRVHFGLHKNKEHGIDLDLMPSNVKLVIVPDASSNEYDIHKELADRGIEVLIIDHHNADMYSPYACVINNQLCDYPNKDLSGAGMVYKFCCYLDKLLDKDYADDYIDLAVFGMIADVMDLRQFETRRMIVKAIDNFRSPFLNVLASANSFQSGVQIVPKTFSWTMAPCINAICRVGNDDDKMLVFQAMLEFLANEEVPSTKRGHFGEGELLCEQAARVAKNVKSGQDRLRDRLSAECDTIIADKNLTQNKILAIKMSNTTQEDRNITGLVANKLMSKYQQPVLILSRRVEDDGSVHWAGSGRNGGDGLESFQKFLQGSGLVDWAQGHDNAFGVSIPDENFTKLIEYGNTQLTDFDFTPKYKIDKIYIGTNIDISDIASLADNNDLWGEGLDEPKILIQNLLVNKANISLSPRGYFKMPMGTELDIVKLKMSEDEYNQIMNSGRATMTIYGSCVRNVGFGDKLQIRIEDYDLNTWAWDF